MESNAFLDVFFPEGAPSTQWRWGPRDRDRFASFPEGEREYAFFQINFCRNILDTRPTHVDALRAAADLMTALGYFEGGLALDRRLVTLCPDRSEVWYNFACSLALVAGPEASTMAAMLALSKAVRLGYDAPDHMKRDPDLARLRRHPHFERLIRRAAANRDARASLE